MDAKRSRVAPGEGSGLDGPRIERLPGLAIRVLRIVTETGTETATETVYCPRRESSQRIDTCAQCSLFRGVHLGARGHAEVSCTRAGPRMGAAHCTRVSEVMSRQVVAVHESAPAGLVRTVLLERSSGHVPVVGDDSLLVGMITLQSLLRRRRLRGEVPRARDLMIPTTLAIPESTSISQASALMAQEDRKALPVIASDRSVVGLVTAIDVLAWLAEHGGYLVTRS